MVTIKEALDQVPNASPADVSAIVTALEARRFSAGMTIDGPFQELPWRILSDYGLDDLQVAIVRSAQKQAVADIATKIDDLTTKVASLATDVALVHSGDFFKPGMMEHVEKCLVVLDFQEDDPSKCKVLNATQLQETIDSRKGKSKAAKLGPAQFNCVGVVLHEPGLICTTKHALHQMMLAKQGHNARKGDSVLVYAPAFGPGKGVLQCKVEAVSKSRDFVLLRVNSDNLEDEGPGSYFLPVCQQGQEPHKTQQVAIVSGRIYISKQDKQPVSVAFDVGRIYSYTDEEVQVTCQTFPGDSGAGIVMVDGKLLGMHTEEQNSSELNVSESESGHSYTHASRALLAYHMLPKLQPC